ncbi:hypothetical protein OH492_14535 [Vibrio chagasii]|nr:hypothetical protein [Vibrio chagasii]
MQSIIYRTFAFSLMLFQFISATDVLANAGNGTKHCVVAADVLF